MRGSLLFLLIVAVFSLVSYFCVPAWHQHRKLSASDNADNMQDAVFTKLQSRKLAGDAPADPSRVHVSVMLSSALNAPGPARQIINLMQKNNTIQVEVAFRQPTDIVGARNITTFIIPALQADYMSKRPSIPGVSAQDVLRDMKDALKELTFIGGHIVLTAPVDPRDLVFVAQLLSTLTGKPLTCSGEAVAGQQLGASRKTSSGATFLQASTLPDVESEVYPISCNFPKETKPHYVTRDGYPTVIEWPQNKDPGSIWVLGYTYAEPSPLWDALLMDIIIAAAKSKDLSRTYLAPSRSPPMPPSSVSKRPAAPAWLSYGTTTSAKSSPSPPSPPPFPPPPPLPITGKNCTAANLKHAQYGIPETWYRISKPLLPCRHEINTQQVVPQCLDGTIVYWDAETGLTKLDIASFSRTCSSPCLTFQSALYYMDGAVETQLVYNTAATNCTPLNRTRICSNGAFGDWSVSGPQYRDTPCDTSCQDDEYDFGAKFYPGQTQVRLFYSVKYVAFGASCASAAVARVRICSPTRNGTFTAWSSGPEYTECFVQCPPPAKGEVVAYAPYIGVLGINATVNRTMYASSVADESGTCPSMTITRTCGEPTRTRIRLETPLQQLAQRYGEIHLAWLPNGPWSTVIPEYPFTECHASCHAPDGQFVPHGMAYSFLMYATNGNLDSLPVSSSGSSGRRRLTANEVSVNRLLASAEVHTTEGGEEVGILGAVGLQLQSDQNASNESAMLRRPRSLLNSGDTSGAAAETDSPMAARLRKAAKILVSKRPAQFSEYSTDTTTSLYGSHDSFDDMVDNFDKMDLQDLSLSDLVDIFKPDSVFDPNSLFWSDYDGIDVSLTSGTSPTSPYYYTSCYNRSVNVYSTCNNGILSYKWLDRNGNVMTSLTGLTYLCTMPCASASGLDVYTRNVYAVRQTDSRPDHSAVCQVIQDKYTCINVNLPDITSMAAFQSNAQHHGPIADPAVVVTPSGRVFDACGPTCAPDCTQSMVGDGRPDPACNYKSCCYDGADYEVSINSKITTAERLVLLNTLSAHSDAVALLGEVCNMQEVYEKDPEWGDDLQRMMVVTACRLQMSVLGGSDITGVAVPNVVLQDRSGFKASIEEMLEALQQIESALTEVTTTGAEHMQLLQQYFYRTKDNTWARLLPTFQGQKLRNGQQTVNNAFDVVDRATTKSAIVGAVIQREFRDIVMSLTTIDNQGDQAQLLLNRLLRSPTLSEAMLITPTGWLLLPDGKTLTNDKRSTSLSIVDEWTKGTLTLYAPSSVQGEPPLMVTAPMSPQSSQSAGSATSPTPPNMIYVHFISIALAIDNATRDYQFVVRGVAAAAVEGTPSWYSLKTGNATDYTGSYIKHNPTGMVLLPYGDRVLIQGSPLEGLLAKKAAAGPKTITEYNKLFTNVGGNAVTGSAWDSDSDGYVSLEELWVFVTQTGLVNELGISVWDAWRKAMYDGVWSKNQNATLLSLLDGYLHPENVSYVALDAVAALLLTRVGAADGITHSFWGYNQWDADYDGRISQADVLRTIGYMGLMNKDGVKIVTELFSSSASGNTTGNSTGNAGRRRSAMSCGSPGSPDGMSTSNSGGSSNSSSSSRKKISWSDALEIVGKVLEVPDAGAWVAASITVPLQDDADLGTASIMMATGTALDAGHVLSKLFTVAKDCGKGALSAVRGGWLGIVGGASHCLASVAEEFIPGPAGHIIGLIADTVAKGIEYIFAPAKLLASKVVQVVKKAASAVGSFFKRLFGRRMIIEDCAVYTNLFESEKSAAASTAYDWVMSEDNLKLDSMYSGDGASGGFFNFIFNTSSGSSNTAADYTADNYALDYASDSPSRIDDGSSSIGLTSFLFGGTSTSGTDNLGSYPDDCLLAYYADYCDDPAYTPGQVDYDYDGVSFQQRRLNKETAATSTIDSASTKARNAPLSTTAITPKAAAGITATAMSLLPAPDVVKGVHADAAANDSSGSDRTNTALRVCTRDLFKLPTQQARACVQLMMATSDRPRTSAPKVLPTVGAESDMKRTPNVGEAAQVAKATSTDEATRETLHRSSKNTLVGISQRQRALRGIAWLAQRCSERVSSGVDATASSRTGMDMAETGNVKMCELLRKELRQALQAPVTPADGISVNSEEDAFPFASGLRLKEAERQQMLELLGNHRRNRGRVMSADIAPGAEEEVQHPSASISTGVDAPTAGTFLLQPSRRSERRRLQQEAAATGKPEVVRHAALQAKLSLFDDVVNEMHRVAQIGFNGHSQNMPTSTIIRTAGLRGFLARNTIPGRASNASATLYGTTSSTTSSDSLEDLLSLNDVQREVLQRAQQRAHGGFTASTTRNDDLAATKSSALSNDAGASNLEQMQGSQSALTSQWWGTIDERIANSKQQLAEAIGHVTPASSKVTFMATTTGSTTSPMAAVAFSASASSSSSSSSSTVSAPYLGPDVPPPAISLSELDSEMNGDGVAGRPKDALYAMLEPLLGPSFEGMGRGLAGMTRNLWATIDAVSGAQQMRAWVDILLEMQKQVANTPQVCTVSDLKSLTAADLPGQWAATATLRGRHGVVLLQMYRSTVQTMLVRQMRRLALQYEMAMGAPSQVVAQMDAVIANISSLPPQQPIAGLLQQVYNTVNTRELAAIPIAPQQSAAVSPPPPKSSSPARSVNFGSNIAVSDRKTATVYYTLTSRTHAYLFRNLSEGMLASVQVPLPRQTKYFDVRMTGVAVRVLADHNTTVTVQHSPSEAAPNHAFVDELGVDMLRACVSSLELPSADSDVAAAIKGPISLYYPDAISALTGQSVSYNHPVPAAYCNVFCPSVGAPAKYVTKGSLSGSLGTSLYSPYGSWLLQYKPLAGQPGFINAFSPSASIYAPNDCEAIPCTFFRAEALQFEFNITYREVTSTAFVGTQASTFFDIPAGDEATALKAGLLFSSSSLDPYTPVSSLADETAPIANICTFTTGHNALRPLESINTWYSTVTQAVLASRSSASGAYASFQSTSYTARQYKFFAFLNLGGISVEDLQGSQDANGKYLYDTMMAKNLLAAIKSFLWQGPSGNEKISLDTVLSRDDYTSITANTSRRGLLSISYADATEGILEPVVHIQVGSHSSVGQGSVQGDATSAVGPARLVYRRRRQLQSSNSIMAIVAVNTDMISGHQAAGLLYNHDMANAGLKSTLAAYGINAQVEVTGIYSDYKSLPSAAARGVPGGMMLVVGLLMALFSFQGLLV